VLLLLAFSDTKMYNIPITIIANTIVSV
jgi:hypothetical protein